MKCIACDMELEDDARFCGGCGAQQPVGGSREAAAQLEDPQPVPASFAAGGQTEPTEAAGRADMATPTSTPALAPVTPAAEPAVSPPASLGEGDLEPADRARPRRRSSPRRNAFLLAAGVTALAVAAVLAILLWWRVSHAAEPANAAARLLPKEIPAFAALDVAQLRAAGPPEVVRLILDAAQPVFHRLGANSAELGQVVAAIAPRVEGGASGGLLIMDLPVDLALLDRDLKIAPTPGLHRGVKVHRGGTTSCGVLPGHRLLCGEDFRVERLIDMAQQDDAPLVDGAAASLLQKVGAAGGRGPAFFAWGRLGIRERDEISTTMPALSEVEQAAAALTLSSAGADVKLVARCLSEGGATALGAATREQIASASRNPAIATLGIKSLVEAARIETSGKEVVATLRLTREQYVDVVTRLGGMAAALAQAVETHDTKAPVAERATKTPAKHHKHKAK